MVVLRCHHSFDLRDFCERACIYHSSYSKAHVKLLHLLSSFWRIVIDGIGKVFKNGETLHFNKCWLCYGTLYMYDTYDRMPRKCVGGRC
jgi:hypothetical protein